MCECVCVYLNHTHTALVLLRQYKLHHVSIDKAQFTHYGIVQYSTQNSKSIMEERQHTYSSTQCSIVVVQQQSPPGCTHTEGRPQTVIVNVVERDVFMCLDRLPGIASYLVTITIHG